MQRFIGIDQEQSKARMSIDAKLDSGSNFLISHAQCRAGFGLQYGDQVITEDSSLAVQDTSTGNNLSQPHTLPQLREWMDNVERITGNPLLICPKGETLYYLRDLRRENPDIFGDMSNKEAKACADAAAIARVGMEAIQPLGIYAPPSESKRRSYEQISQIKWEVRNATQAGAKGESLKGIGRTNAHPDLKIVDQVSVELEKKLRSGNMLDEQTRQQFFRFASETKKRGKYDQLASDKSGKASPALECMILSMFDSKGNRRNVGRSRTWNYLWGNNPFRGKGNGVTHSRIWWFNFASYRKRILSGMNAMHANSGNIFVDNPAAHFATGRVRTSERQWFIDQLRRPYAAMLRNALEHLHTLR